jgi:aminoglycoside phosphotransferase (APT) family kinase protein
MALKNKLDAGAVGQYLASWLPDALKVPGPVEVSEVTIPSASGMSSETVLFEASWQQDGELVTKGLVARIPPHDGGLFETYDLGREVKVMSLLSAHTDAPIPRVLAHEATGDVLGSPFALLERAYGKVPGDDPPFVTAGWVLDLTPDQRARMFDEALQAIAAIQQADAAALGLTELRHDDLGDTVIEQELEFWRRFYHWAGGETPSPTIDKAFELLADSRPTDDEPLVVSWGDARFGNLMFGTDQKVTGVFDWEMATLGRPEVDLGYFLFFDRVYSTGIGVPRLEGFPERNAAIARFEDLTGRTMRDLDWFEAWAALRGAILLLRVGKQMIELGQLPPDAPMPFNNPAAQVLASLLDLPAPAGAPGWITGHR